MKNRLLYDLALSAMLACPPAFGADLVRGGQFMDLILPMEDMENVAQPAWGIVRPRYVDNGIEDATRSYWGGNIVRGDDGKYHIYVAGWPESSAQGHATWSNGSRVYHVTADNVSGPYTFVADIGAGHNPELYRTGDTYVIYKISPLGYYKSSALGNEWEMGEYTFDLRSRPIIAGENREVSLSNCTFAKREDGSFVMMDRGGGVWVSRDGLSDPWHHLTDATAYGRPRGTLEDPVIWHDHLQYHLIVNDWQARYAYYYRSPDGLHYVMEAGKAYTGEDGFSRHADGSVEAWYKYERPRVYQDSIGRAIYMNFAVIDTVKAGDKGNDNHSSKNIIMPLVRPLLLDVVDADTITAATTVIRVRVRAEGDFRPQTDLDVSSLRFGSHTEVNYGRGFVATASEADGDDLILTFTGTAGASGIDAAEWAPKMLGSMADGSIAFGYARLPYVDYRPAMLSASLPEVDVEGSVTAVKVTNYGQSAAKPTTVQIYAPGGRTLLAEGTTSAVEPYADQTVRLTSRSKAVAGYANFVVRFSTAGTLLNSETLPTTEITQLQAALQARIDEAVSLSGDETLTAGREALLGAIEAARAVVKTYSRTDIEAQSDALLRAINSFKYANATPSRGFVLDVPSGTMDALEPWALSRSKARGDAPGWALNARGDSYAGFSGNFMEYWVTASGPLGFSNRAEQTLTSMPAGRYRLKAYVLACRQGRSTAVAGVSLFAADAHQECSTPTGLPQQVRLDFTLTADGDLTLGLDIDAATEANWVAWDNVVLTYYGTADGEIVDEEPQKEVHVLDTERVYFLRHFNTRRPRYLRAEPLADGTLTVTDAEGERGHFCFTPVEGRDDYYVVRETSLGNYVVPSTQRWTLSPSEQAAVRVVSNDDYAATFVGEGTTWLLGETNQHANPQQSDGVNQVKAYADHPADSGNNWELIPIEGETPPTAITTLRTDAPADSHVVTDLLGRRPAARQRGLLIVGDAAGRRSLIFMR